MTQPQLFDAGPGHLTERQQFVLDLLKRHPEDGVTADEVGAALCERAGRHDAGSRCNWDATNGRSVLQALRKKGLARRPRSGGWRVIVAQEPVEAVEADPFPEGY